MKKINKNLEDIPLSLITSNDQLTHIRRLEIIAKKKYINERPYNDRYKTDDIRDKLKQLYNNKCVFCEQKVEQYNVEHFRPKNIYYWLAYSWDNLLLACDNCNIYKGKKFEIRGKRAKCPNIESLKNINTIASDKYDIQEHPMLINPEQIDPKPYLKFEKDGRILSDNENFEYTIKICKIDRKYLNDERKKIIDKFRRGVTSELVENQTIGEQKHAINVLVRHFLEEANDNDNEFLAFRSFAIEHDWLKDIIKEAVTSI
jgi:hypothetical protein